MFDEVDGTSGCLQTAHAPSQGGDGSFAQCTICDVDTLGATFLDTYQLNHQYAQPSTLYGVPKSPL